MLNKQSIVVAKVNFTFIQDLQLVQTNSKNIRVGNDGGNVNKRLDIIFLNIATEIATNTITIFHNNFFMYKGSTFFP